MDSAAAEARIEPGAPSDSGSAAWFSWDGVDRRAAALLECAILLGVDRPDLLEARILDREPQFLPPAESGAAALPAPGAPLRLRLADEHVFHGIVERVELEARAGELAAASLRACSAYHLRRAAVPAEVWRQATVAEIAGHTAIELGLEPRVACHDVLLPEVRRTGDPLRFLRRLAAEHGLELAVAGGRLHLAADLTGRGELQAISAGGPLTGMRFAWHADGSRRAELSLAGLASLRPLDSAELVGFGRGRDGRYRVRRCRLRFDGVVWRTDLDLLDATRGGPVDDEAGGDRGDGE